MTKYTTGPMPYTHERMTWHITVGWTDEGFDRYEPVSFSAIPDLLNNGYMNATNIRALPIGEIIDLHRRTLRVLQIVSGENRDPRTETSPLGVTVVEALQGMET